MLQESSIKQLLEKRDEINAKIEKIKARNDVEIERRDKLVNKLIELGVNIDPRGDIKKQAEELMTVMSKKLDEDLAELKAQIEEAEKLL